MRGVGGTDKPNRARPVTRQRLTATGLAASADTTSPERGVKAGRPIFRSVSDARNGIVNPCPIIVPLAAPKDQRKSASGRREPADGLHQPAHAGRSPPSASIRSSSSKWGPGRAACWLPRRAAATLSANGRPIRASSRQRWTCARHSRCSSPLPATVFSSWSRTRGRPQFAAHPVGGAQGVVERHPQHRPHAPLAGRRLRDSRRAWPRRRRGGPRWRPRAGSRAATASACVGGPAPRPPWRARAYHPRPSDKHDLTKVGVRGTGVLFGRLAPAIRVRDRQRLPSRLLRLADPAAAQVPFRGAVLHTIATLQVVRHLFSHEVQRLPDPVAVARRVDAQVSVDQGLVQANALRQLVVLRLALSSVACTASSSAGGISRM